MDQKYEIGQGNIFLNIEKSDVLLPNNKKDIIG